VLRREHSNSQTARAEGNGSDVVGWCYIMHKYLPYSSKSDRTREYFGMIDRISRRLLRGAVKRDWSVVLTHFRSLLTIVQSYSALLFEAPFLIPERVRLLLCHDFNALRG